ncbi:MAG: hypothetical protein IVW57_05550 [Ktedonobacterales bacterium]|nr:hypothetical protein [Ktedonobacterales bacterium]
MLHPDWDIVQVAEEVALIKGENTVALPSMVPPDFGPPSPEVTPNVEPTAGAAAK